MEKGKGWFQKAVSCRYKEAVLASTHLMFPLGLKEELGDWGKGHCALRAGKTKQISNRASGKLPYSLHTEWYTVPIQVESIFALVNKTTS
jgi:hypothetical protein